MSEKILDEETKQDIREMPPKVRATLREWFADSPHFQELIEYIDFLNGKPDHA
jgi:hypothetical protein